MARPKLKSTEEKITKGNLHLETEDTLFTLGENSYLKRKKGTSEVTLHRDGRGLNVNDATIEDFDYLYVKEFLENVKNTTKLKIDKTLFYTDAQMLKLSREEVLDLADILTFKHCDVCPIKLNKDSSITKSNYCLVSCEVGVELQQVGSVFEQRGRRRLDRGKRAKISTEDTSRNSRIDNNDLTRKEVRKAREIILQRRLKTLKAIYTKLVSPKTTKAGTTC